MSHKNIIALREVIDDPCSRQVYLITDYYEGGSLAELLDKTESGLPEH